MKEKLKICLPWLVKAYLVYSVILDACVVGGIAWLIIKQDEKALSFKDLRREALEGVGH